jgi:RNA polymerase sigma-70 factor, ECF subfamily
MENKRTLAPVGAFFRGGHTRSNDAQLLAAAHGDDAALRQLIQTYHARVYRFGRRVCRRPEDAEDAVQEAFIKLMRRPDVVAHPGALSWLFSVVRRACALSVSPLLLLVPRQTLKDVMDSLETEQPGPEQALQRWELVQAVHAAIAQLDPPYREVLVLRDIEGLSAAQTCRVLGIELASMKSRLHRARNQLRESLRPDAARARAGEVSDV